MSFYILAAISHWSRKTRKSFQFFLFIYAYASYLLPGDVDNGLVRGKKFRKNSDYFFIVL